ncbi:MAG: metal ABC transporter permease [Gammaproteobacteria bacterium]|nr:metal ABC transporter permease [Gammaproteobacteria bacterium]
MNLDSVDLSILGPAMLAGLLVLATHVPLGQQVLARGIIFLDLAVAQLAALGVIIAYSAGLTPGGWQVQVIAITAALLGALLLYLVEQFLPQVQEAVIGCVFVLAASGSILVLNANPHGNEALKDLLAGQILWVSYEQLLPVAMLFALILALWFGLRQHRHPLLFYVLFALTVTISVQLVGVYLVFASLIMPALAIRIAQSNQLWIAYGIGALAYLAGLIASAIFDLPSGAAVVWSLAIVSTFTAMAMSLRRRGATMTN